MILVPSDRNRVFLPMGIFETKKYLKYENEVLKQCFKEIFKDLCHAKSSTISRGFVFSYAYNFSKQASTPFSVKVERECTGWELESGLILSGKFLGCARGMNTMGAQNEFKGI